MPNRLFSKRVFVLARKLLDIFKYLFVQKHGDTALSLHVLEGNQIL